MQPTSWEVSVDHEHLVTTKTDVACQHPDGNCLFRSVYAVLNLKDPKSMLTRAFRAV